MFADLLLYLFVPSLSLWWILPIALGGYVTAALLYWLFIIVVWCFLPSKKQAEQPIPICTALIRLTAEWFCSVARVRLCLNQKEPLPQEPCVIVCNHLSNFDPMAVLALLKTRRPVFLSKKEVFELPLAGRYLRGACFLSVDRSNPRKAVQALQVAGEEMQHLGVDAVIYPEGTRSRSGNLLRFKEGGFVLAKQADAPIAVYGIRGTDSIKKRFPFRSTTVRLELIAVIEKETVRQMDPKELCVYTHDLVEEALKK